MVNEQQPMAGGAVSSAARARAAGYVGQTMLGRYRVEELVAMGGLAAVFRAQRVDTGEEVAIKVLHTDAQGLKELVLRFEREAIAGRHIYHPNVAATHEMGQLEDGSWCMVMEFIRGVTLAEVMVAGPIPPLRAARIARQIAIGLNAAHDMGIVHRDLKPLNVMILKPSEGATEDSVKLIDFGFAKVPVEELVIGNEPVHRQRTQSDIVMGTVDYLAPEAVHGMHAVDRRSDLYALGVMLYQMLASQHPFDAGSPIDVFNAHQKAPVPPIAKRAPAGVVVPPALEAIVRKLLEKDPANRFFSARALIVALERAIDEMEGKRSRWQRLDRRFVGLAGGVLVALAIVVVWLVMR